MSAPNSKQTQPTATTFNERLNEQLINCLNVQTNVIQNLSQYSQHISLQLLEIKSIVEMLSNRVLALQQQQQYNQPSHFAASPYVPPYYSNFMPPPPIPIPHPPPSSHPPPGAQIPFSFPQHPPPVRVSPPTTTTATSQLPFFPTTTNQSTSLSSAVPLFQFSMSSSTPTAQTTLTSTLATATTPPKFSFSNQPKVSVGETITKSPSTFPSAPTSLATNTNEKPPASNPFGFGTDMKSIFGTGTFNFGSSPIVTTKPEANADDDGDDGAENDYVPDKPFSPIVTLQPVEVKTGEEDENVLFCERAKLYRFDSVTNQMKERGIGEMKILQHKTTNTCRILMRREQVLKVCANHKITSQMELKPHQGSANAYLWSAMDFADGEAKHETLCIKFKTEEQAKAFSKTFNEAKEINMKKSGDLPAVDKISLEDEVKVKQAANDDDVISIGEVKPSAEQIDRAHKLQLPSTFFLYENKEPCKGCPGCEKDTAPSASSENKTTASKQSDVVKTETKTPSSPASTVKASSSTNEKFSFGVAEKPQSSLQKQSSTTKEEKSSVESTSPAPSAASQYDNKPSIFGNTNGSSSTSIFGSSSPLLNTGGSIFGVGSSSKSSTTGSSGFSFPGFGNTSSAATTSTNGFQFSTPTTSSSTTVGSPNVLFGGTAVNKTVFGNTPKFSFSDIAKQSPTTTDKLSSGGSDQRVFAGQGALIFGTTSTTATTKANNNDEDDGDGAGGEDDSYEPNVSFKPIVQLSAVEVKTGEEDENVLFCERAKLYRFDSVTNQMKERGIGEMKILQHKTTNTCRILMRREQVLKVCANHKITSQMELKPHQGSANAYLWSAMDFADGEAKHETLCIRFKNDDHAKRFVKEFNEAKQINASSQQ